MDDLIHGGALSAMAAAFPDAALPWIDLSTGINPWPYPIGDLPPSVWTALPDHTTTADCVAALGGAIDCPPATIILTPGSSAGMMAVKRALNINHIAVLMPTYGGYQDAFGTCTYVDSLGDAVASKARAIIVGQPNNPDGIWHDLGTLAKVAAALAKQGRWLIVDEAFGDLEPDQCVTRHAGADGLIILRSFGKFYGLAGLRLGAIVAPQGVTKSIAQELGPWPVSGPALEIGARAYVDKAWQSRTRQLLARQASTLDLILIEAGLTVTGGTDLFRLVTTNDAHALWYHLASYGIYVRRFSWSKMHVRIGLPTDGTAYQRLKIALSLLV